MVTRNSRLLVEKSRRIVYRQKPKEAVLGDGFGNIYADGMYFCRWPGPADENGNATYSAPFRAFGGTKNFIEQNNRGVYIKQNHKGQLEIDGAIYEDLQAAGIKPSAMHPNSPYRQFVRLDDIQNFKAIPISKTSMKVRVGELFYQDRNGIPRFFPGSVAAAITGNPAVHVDLTSYIPATTDYECFALISFNQDDWAAGSNPLEVSVSTAQSSVPSTLDITDIQQAYAGMSAHALPVKAFRLYQGMTGLKGDPKDLEGRQLVNVPSGGMTSFNVAADIGTAETIVDGSTLTFESGALLDSYIDPPNRVTYSLSQGAGRGTGIGYNAFRDPYETANAVDLPAIAGETLTSLLYLRGTDDRFWKADSDGNGTLSSVRGVLQDAAGPATVGTDIIVRQHGFVDTGGTSLTNGEPIYLSTTAGGYTQTPPSPSLGGSQIASVRYGHAASTALMHVDTHFPVRYLKRVSLANNATTTVTHYADVTPAERKVYAMISTNDIAVIETSGGTQDSAKQLRGQSGAGALITVDTAGVTDTGIGNASGNQLKDAQSFTVVTAGALSQVTFFLNPNTGSPTGDLIVSVRDNNAGVPAALSLWSTTHTPSVNANNTIPITNGPFLLPSGVYWLVLECATSQTLNNRFNVRRSTINPYAGGEMKVDSSASPGSWNIIAAGSDMRCTVTTAAVVTNDGLAQGFSHSSTTTVPYIDVYLQRTGTLSGNLTLAIYSDTGGMPNAVITNGTAGTVAASSVTTSYTLIRFTFSTPPTITASTQYHIVLTTSDSASNTAYVEWGIDQSSPPYANGAFAQLQSAAWGASSPAADGLFDVYGIVTTFGEPAVVGRWSGGTRDLAVRYDDGSGANPTTNTTFKNTSGVTLDVTCIVEMP